MLKRCLTDVWFGDIPGSGDSMLEQDAEIINSVYKRFIDSEEERTTWNGIDESMYRLQWIDNDQLIRETKIALAEHQKGTIKCNIKHTNSVCFAPKIVRAAAVISDICEQLGEVSDSNKYILQYYLALHHLKIIYSE